MNFIYSQVVSRVDWEAFRRLTGEVSPALVGIGLNWKVQQVTSIVRSIYRYR